MKNQEREILTKRICTVAECGKPHVGRGYCRKHYMNDWYRRHPEGLASARERMAKVPKEVMRDRALRYAYGVNSEWYAHQLVKQNGVCAICGKPETKMIKGVVLRLAVDHCHDSNDVRGLLCQACNRGIGCFGHDVATLQAAIAFLQSPPAKRFGTPGL